MKILFISKHKHPHIGGVEKHIKSISEVLTSEGHKVTTVSGDDTKQPKIKFIGLLSIWYWLFKNRSLIKNTDIVHIHDVFIWYLPFRFLFPTKKVFVTFHGWEGKYPLTIWSIINKRTANYLCSGSIAVGKYIEKYYKIKADYIIHGAAQSVNHLSLSKIKNTIVWFGRQDMDTGINEFRKWLVKQKTKCGIKYITNDPNPEKYLKTAEYCVPAGYLSYLEAKSYGCKIITFASNPLKVEYWNEIKLLKKIPTWDEVVNVYLKLWKV